MHEAVPVIDRFASPRRTVLTAVELDVLWERLGLGPAPVVLQLPSPGRSVAERRDVQARGLQALRERGLADVAGPDPTLAHQLRQLARPSEQLELRGSWGHSVRALAAGRPGSGVLAVRRDATITLESCGSLPSSLLAVLPEAGPGPGRAATAPTTVIAAGLSATGSGMRAALIAHGLPSTDAALLSRMLRTGHGRAQIVALAVDASGVARRAGGVLGVVDGPYGRYLLTRSVADDGVEWTTVAPVDNRTLRHRVSNLLDHARTTVDSPAISPRSPRDWPSC